VDPAEIGTFYEREKPRLVMMLALVGGAVGVILGVITTAVYAHVKDWAIVIPAEAWAGGLGVAMLIGALAGLLPAIRAARLSPTQALWTL
jgi:putative ABC transport system permease protein